MLLFPPFYVELKLYLMDCFLFFLTNLTTQLLMCFVIMPLLGDFFFCCLCCCFVNVSNGGLTQMTLNWSLKIVNQRCR